MSHRVTRFLQGGRATFACSALVAATLFFLANPGMPPALAKPDAAGALRHYERADGLYKSGDFAVALSAIEQAITLDPLPIYEGFRAWCVFRLGDQAEGLRIMELLSLRRGIGAREREDFRAAAARMRSKADMAPLTVVVFEPGFVVRVDGGEPMDAFVGARTVAVLTGSHEVEAVGGSGALRRHFRVEQGAGARAYFPEVGVALLEPARPGASLEIDGKATQCIASRFCPVPTGEHRLELRAGGQVLWSRKTSLRAGEELLVGASPAPPLTVSEPTSEALVPMWAKHVSAVGGAVAAGAAAWLHVSAESDASDLKAELSASGPLELSGQDQALRDRDSVHDRRVAAGVLYGAGGLLLGAALLGYLLDDPAPEVEASLAPAAGGAWQATVCWGF